MPTISPAFLWARHSFEVISKETVKKTIKKETGDFSPMPIELARLKPSVPYM